MNAQTSGHNHAKQEFEMKRRIFLSGTGAFAVLAALPTFPVEPAKVVQVFKSPTCGCCSAWVAHMKSAGFVVKVAEVHQTAIERKRLGMPERFGSCHTATVDGYVLEGHVPAVEVKRLLAARPKVIGLAVPSMPPGSPGMEIGGRKDPYDVLLIDPAGQASVYASYPK
jgi:hypothetical protein